MTISHKRVPLELGVDLSTNLIEPGDLVEVEKVRIVIEGSDLFAEFDVDDTQRLSDSTEVTFLSISIVKDLGAYEDEFGPGDVRQTQTIEIDGEPYIAVIEFSED